MICWITRREKGKAIMTEGVVARRNQVPSARIRVRVSLEKPAEILVVLSDTKEYLVALKKIAERVIPLLKYLDTKLGKYAGTTNNGSYVELVRNRTRAKVAATSAAASKERQLQETEVKYEREHAHAAELTAKMKALAECEAARISDQEMIEKFEAQCNELRSQRA
ncbi:hypothetical protein AXG93_4620s1000 [Marchantia polymorpha subsp. ruderalis]|uniref:Uncharacterized protein n=1 Tax=Marchantia polymorpha subsp. ruderalis TaxID=1480154 RepID=A0A176VX02_MARPO|nr:hypothetical protein AXG93_4620s1000 [Marchantia polymorpha subsp. ruderalis]